MAAIEMMLNLAPLHVDIKGKVMRLLVERMVEDSGIKVFVAAHRVLNIVKWD